MAGRKKAGLYAPVSLEALKLIAKREKLDPRLLLAYLALARHTTMNDLDGRGPNMLTGAGAEKVRVITGCGTPIATGMVRALANMGLIKKPEPGLPKKQSLWAMQHQGTVNIPHALIDGIEKADGINRLLKQGASDQVVTCAIMLLMYCYLEHDLEEYGGINPDYVWREWKHQVIAEGEVFKVVAEPGDGYTTQAWQTLILGSMGVERTEENAQSIFWPAFNLLRDTSLIYEVVSAFNKKGGRLAVRVNDYHASDSDPSLLGMMQGSGFYAHKDNDNEEPEGCWFYLTVEPSKLVGIWRLRFRCATPDTAAGIDQDLDIIETLIGKLRPKLVEAELLYDE